MWQQRIAAVEAGGAEAVADAAMERFFSAAFRASQPERVARYRATLARTDTAGYAACCHAVAGVDWLARLPQVRCPTLVIAGAQDMGAPVAMSQAIAERIAGAQLVVLPDAAHLSAVEQPEQFAQHVQQFLARLH
jgi:3-oxoadipate enol-lactonase